LDKVEKAMLQLIICHYELIFGIFTIPKYDFVEGEEALFQAHAWHYQPILGLCTSPKCDLGEVNKAIFSCLQGTANSFSAP